MAELAQLQLLLDLFGDQTTGKTKLTGGVGDSLFKNLLERSHQSLSRGEVGLSPSADSTKASAQQEERGRLAKLDQGVRQLGLPSGLRLPKSAVPQLTKLLEAQGLGTEEIKTLIASVTDRDGSLRLDRLMTRLQAIQLLERSHQSLGGGEAGRLAGLDQEARQLGISTGQLRLPGSAALPLTQLLETQGLGREEINSLIASGTDRDGFLRLDRLMTRLKASRKQDKSDEDRKMIAAKDIPLLGEALLAMGVGPGQVKEVIEKSLTQKGEVALDPRPVRSASLVPGIPERPCWPPCWSVLRSRPTSRPAQKGSADPEVKKRVKDFTEAPSQDAQKKMKEEIGQLLRQKGVPPQEVKSFLETLAVGYGRTLSKKAETGQAGAEKAEAEAGAKAMMEKVVLRTDSKRPSDEWRDKILTILQKEQGVPRQNLERQWFHQEALARASGGEALKGTEQKLAAIQTEGARIPEARLRAGLEAGQGIPAGRRRRLRPIRNPRFPSRRSCRGRERP